MGDPVLGEWTNLGYFEVAGAVDFPELDVTKMVNTVIGANAYALPAGLVQIQTVYDSVAKYGLRRVEKAELFRQDLAEPGAPKIWTRHGASLYIHPTPTTIRSLSLIGRSEPDQMVADADKTILPKTWDAAIKLLAVCYALWDLNEDARATTWYNRALNYMQSRLIEGQMQNPAAPGGQ